MTVWSSGVVNAQYVARVLAGTKAGNYEATSLILSTQTLSKGTTTYVAGDQIVLRPGFRVKAGSEFVATIDNPSNYLTIMTYNVHKEHYEDNGKVIKESNADIVSIQEITDIEDPGGALTNNAFKTLKDESGLEGVFYPMHEFKIPTLIPPLAVNHNTGIALLWDQAKLGRPKTAFHRIFTYFDDGDIARGYIIAEWDDFVVVATHLSTDIDANKRLVQDILKENAVKSGKTVFIAGDLNPRPSDGIPRPSDGYETKKHLQNNGFEILNRTDRDDKYMTYHATNEGGGTQPDLILWKNKKSNSRMISRGVPECLWAKDESNDYPGGLYQNWRFHISDHLPYIVKVKFK